MPLFGRKSQPTPAPTPAQISATHWHDIANVRREWPQTSLDADRDLQKWRQGVALYENDDYLSMMRCAEALAPSVAHSLYGVGILRGDDLPNTTFKLLFASLSAPPDGQTFTETTQKYARLALTTIRENGWTPPSFGGTNGFFEPILSDHGSNMLLRMVVGPEARPWEGDLRAFFRVQPTPVTPVATSSELASGTRAVNAMHDVLTQAEAGDVASDHHIRGMGLWANGRLEEARVEIERAAEMGSPDAMKDAGDLAMKLGEPSQASFWFESAANLGNPGAMWNLAVLALNDGDRAAAATWYQACAEAGDPDGYAALAQLASDRDDGAAERRWASCGAAAGQTFCMARHGLFLMMDHDNDVPKLREARELLEEAARRGDQDAIGLAVSVNSQLGDPARARPFLEMALQSGNEELIDRLRRHGFLGADAVTQAQSSPDAAREREEQYRCMNTKCSDFGQARQVRQCPTCFHYGSSA